MRRAFLVAGMVLLCVSPAWAQRVWTTPAPVTDPVPIGATVAIAADGTTMTAWNAGSVGGFRPAEPVLQFDGGTPDALRLGYSHGFVVAAAPGGKGVVAYSDGDEAYATFPHADGTFSTPEDIGAGDPAAVAINSAGDAVVVLNRYPLALNEPFQLAVAFRPAGGAFGAAVPLTSQAFASLALAPDGEVLVGTATGTMNDRPVGLQVFHGMGSAPDSAGRVLTTDGSDPSVVIDGRHRALAAWLAADRNVMTETRDATGTWAAPRRVPAAASSLQAATDPAGDAVVAWHDSSAFVLSEPAPIRAASLSLADGVPSRSVEVMKAAGEPSLGVGADGTAVIAAGQPVTQVARRDGTGPFGLPQVAANFAPALNSSPLVAGVEADGTATLLLESSLTHDAPGPVYAPCSATPTVHNVLVRRRRVRTFVSTCRAGAVRVTVRSRGRVIGSVQRALIAASTRIRVPISRHHAHLRIVLRQNGAVVDVFRAKA